MSYKINKQKCIGCGVCQSNCPGAIKLGADGKAEIINQKKLEECGGERLCPFGAIEKQEEGPEGNSELESEPNEEPRSFPSSFSSQGRGMGKRMGRGMGKRRGRGIGRTRGERVK